MRDIVLRLTDNEELEKVIPVDRVITIDSNNIVSLSDTQFIIDEKDIERVI